MSAATHLPNDERPPRPRTGGRSLVPLLGATVMVNMGFGAIFALLAEIQDRFALPTWGLGVIVGASFGIAFTSQLLLAKQADRGHAHRLMIAGVVLAVIGLAWMGLFASTLLEFTLARSILSLGEGALMPAARRVVVMRDPDAAGERLGQLGGASIAGFLVGSPVAALMTSAWGIRVPFLLMAVVTAVFLPSLLTMSVPTGEIVDTTKGLMGRLIRMPAVKAAIALNVAEYTSIGVFDAVYTRYLTDLGASTTYIGVTLAVFATPLVVLAPFGGRLADRHGAFRVALIALAITVPAQALYGAYPSVVFVTAVVLLHTLFEAIAIPTAQAAVADAVPPEAIASGQGLAQAVGLAAAGVISVVSPAIYGWSGAGWVYSGSAVVMLLVLGVAVVYNGRAGEHTSTPGFSPAGTA